MGRGARGGRRGGQSAGQPLPPTMPGAVIALALLTGVGFALLLIGFLEGVYEAIDFTPFTLRIALGSVLAATATGQRLPQRLALTAAAAARRLLGERLNGPAEVVAAQRAAGGDGALMWTVAGVAGLAAGIGALGMPWLLAAAWAVAERGWAGFVWTGWSLRVFDALIVFLAASVPFGLIGFLARCVNQVASPAADWRLAPLGWMLLGAALGSAGAGMGGGFAGRGGILQYVAVIPLLMTAMLAVTRSVPARSKGKRSSRRPAVLEPDLDERWLTMLYLAVAVGVTCLWTAGMLWVYALGSRSAGQPGMALWGSAVLLAATGSGLLAADRLAYSTNHSIGDVGMRVAISGGAMAAGTALFAATVQRGGLITSLATPAGVRWAACAAGPLGLLAYAMGHGGIAVLRRSAARPMAGSRLLQLSLLAATLSAALVTLTLLRSLGSFATLVASALGLLAVGGILVIHEPVSAARRSRPRVAVVFATVLLMTWLMPLAGRGWQAGRQASAGPVRESWWSVSGRSDHGKVNEGGDRPEGAAGAGGVVAWDRVPGDCRVAWLGWRDLQPLLDPAASRADRHLFEPTLEGGPNAERRSTVRQGGKGAMTSAAGLDALRHLRTTKNRYDLVVLSLVDAPPEVVTRALQPVVLERAWGRLRADGVLIAIASGEGDTEGELHRRLLTFAAHENRPGRFAAWARTSTSSGDGVAVFCGRGAAAARRTMEWSAGVLSWATGSAPEADLRPGVTGEPPPDVP